MTAATNATVPGRLTIGKDLPRQVLDSVVAGVSRPPLRGIGGFSRAAMLLTFVGRMSGRRYTLPLAYLRGGDTVATFAIFTNTVWWNNLRDGAPVEVRLRGQDHAGTAEVIEDPEAVARGLVAMAGANPAKTRRGYYAVPRTVGGEIDREALLGMARTRVMIRVRLGPSGGPAAGREATP